MDVKDEIKKKLVLTKSKDYCGIFGAILVQDLLTSAYLYYDNCHRHAGSKGDRWNRNLVQLTQAQGDVVD